MTEVRLSECATQTDVFAYLVTCRCGLVLLLER